MFLKLHLQVVFDDLVDGIYLFVGLKVINRGEAFLNIEFVTEFSKLFVVELCAIF